MSQPLDPIDRRREEFRMAAHRRLGRTTLRERLFRPRSLVIVVALLGSSAGLATALNLISVGHPRVERHEPKRYQRPPGSGLISVTAVDPKRSLPWGVLVYRSATGQECAAAGQVRGAQLGVIQGDHFQPYAAGAGGACGNTRRSPFYLDIRYLSGRGLVYGRARRDVKTVEVNYAGRHFHATTGPGGAFLFVFGSDVRGAALRITPRAANGRIIR